MTSAEEKQKRKIETLTDERNTLQKEVKKSRTEVNAAKSDLEQLQKTQKAEHEKSKYWKKMAEKARDQV